jgi:hypothetical protein
MDNAALAEAVEREFGTDAREMIERTGVVVDQGPLLHVSTPGLLRLTMDGARRNYNRVIPAHLTKRLDFQGTHILRRWLWHYHAQGELVERHERCQCYLKLRGRKNPYEFMLDFDSEMLAKWAKLIDPDLRGIRVGDVWISSEGVTPDDS